MLFPGQGDRVILPAHSTRASFHKKKIDPFARANSSCAGSDCLSRLSLTDLTRLGELKCLSGEIVSQTFNVYDYHWGRTRSFPTKQCPHPARPQKCKKFTILRMFTGFPWEY